MDRGCRVGALLLLGCFILWASVLSADAAIDLHVDGRVITSESALALLGSGLGLSLPALEDEFGFIVDDSDFPVVALRYGERVAVVVADDRRAVVDGQRVELQAPPRVLSDTLFVPLHLVADMVDLRVNWDVVSGTLKLQHRPTGTTYVIPASRPTGTGSKAAVSSSVSLSSTPVSTTPPWTSIGPSASISAEGNSASTGTVFFVRTGGDMALSPAILYDVGISIVNRRVQLEVATDKEVDAKVMFMPNPARLVVDVPDAVLGTGWRSMPGDGDIIKQIRASATEDGGVRLVADLTAPTGYKLQFAEDGRGFTVQLNHQLALLSVEPTGSGGIAVHLHSTGPLKYTVFPLREPARLVIDLAGATVAGAQEIKLRSQFASSIRVSQFEHDVVRAVVELRGTGTAAFFISRLAGGIEGEALPGSDGTFSFTVHPLNGVAVERRMAEPTLGNVQSVAIMQQGGTEFVLVEADTPLAPELRRFREPERLVLDLPGVQLERSLGLTAGLAEKGVVGTVRAGQAEPTVGRIVVETAGIVEQHLFMSPDRKRAVLALRPSQLGGRTIVVDPGHGGRDPGAIGHSGTYEKDVTLSIALQVARLLEQAGATVVLTRDADVTVELASRSQLANALDADAFVSIHADAIGFGRVASGTSTFYYPENGNGPETSVNRRYAKSLQKEMLNALGLQDRGVHERAFHVVLNTTMPSALVEVGFIDNPDEEKLLIDPDFQAQAAAGIVHGILRFFVEEEQLAVPDARQQWTLASEQVVRRFLQSGEVPGQAIALVPTPVLGYLLESSSQDAGF